MKEYTKAEFNHIDTVFYSQNELDKSGTFFIDNEEILSLCLRAKTLPVFLTRDGFMNIGSSGEIPLEKMLEVVADSVSKPKWEVYAIYDPNTKKYYYDSQNLFLQSMLEGEKWQKN